MAKPNNTNAAFDAEMLAAYFDGRLSAKEAHALEMQAMEDPFLAEAMEGFSEHGYSPEHSTKLKTKLHQRTHGSGNAVWFIGVVISVLAVTFALFFLSGDSDNAIAETVQNIEENIPETTSSNASAEEESELHSIEVVERSQTDSSMSFTIRQALPPEIPAATEEIKEEEHFVAREPAIEPVSPQEPSVIQDDEGDKEDRQPMLPGAAIYHVLNYKLVDYRGKREIGWEAEELLTGTNAAISDSSEEPLIVPQKTQVAYVDYLNETMEKFAEERFSSAERGFSEILSHFPDDANALFYGGLTAYYQGELQLAAERFQRSQALTINTFQEESEFYLAMSWQGLGETEKADSLFQVIHAQGGFYSERAKR